MGGQGGPLPMILPGRAVSAVFRRGRYAVLNEDSGPVRAQQFPGPRGFFCLVVTQVREAVPAYGSSDPPAASRLRGETAWETPGRKPGRFRGYLGLGGWA